MEYEAFNERPDSCQCDTQAAQDREFRPDAEWTKVGPKCDSQEEGKDIDPGLPLMQEKPPEASKQTCNNDREHR